MTHSSVRRWSFVFACGAVIFGGATAGAKPPQHALSYVMETIESPTGLNTAALGVNDWGEVVGVYEKTPGHLKGFVWSRDEGFRALAVPMLFQNIPYGDIAMDVWDINNCGVIVGNLADGKAVRWLSPDHAERFGFQYPNGEFYNARPSAINDLGQIVGETISPVDGRQVPFLWSPQQGMREINSFPGDQQAVANGINNRGEVVGESTDFVIRRAFLWTATGGIQNLGVDAPYAVAISISDTGVIVGNYRPADAPADLAFRWTRHTGPLVLNDDPSQPLGSGATDVNAFGLVAGTHAAPSNSFHASVWDRRGHRTDLHKTAAEVSVAHAINLFGVVVGQEYSYAGQFTSRATVWWPSKYPTKLVRAAKERAAAKCASGQLP